MEISVIVSLMGGLGLFLLGMKYGDKLEESILGRLKEQKHGKTE